MPDFCCRASVSLGHPAQRVWEAFLSPLCSIHGAIAVQAPGSLKAYYYQCLTAGGKQKKSIQMRSLSSMVERNNGTSHKENVTSLKPHVTFLNLSRTSTGILIPLIYLNCAFSSIHQLSDLESLSITTTQALSHSFSP